MREASFPQDKVFWYLDLDTIQPLREPLNVDVVVVGGGMAGLSAAQCFHEKGFSVTLLEKNFCGAGASGKSSGFITPDSELSLSNLVDLYGIDDAHKLWKFVLTGVNLIEHNIKNFSLDCDYQQEDTLVVANSKKEFSFRIQREHEMRIKLGYASTLYPQEKLSSVLGSSAYYGGVYYPNSFGINAYKYCQSMKRVLIKKGVKIYEETPVIKIHPDGVDTVYNSVKAKKIIVCIDKFLPDLGILPYEIYHAQTFLMMSSPLSDIQVRQIFPDRTLMVWDTDLIYSYYRLTGDNRLLLGGSSLLYTYASQENHHNLHVIKKLTDYFRKKFPSLAIHFEYVWPGLIGLTKDIMPLAGYDSEHPNIYYIGGCAGLPWAAALGNYCVEQYLEQRNDYDKFFSPQRKFFLGRTFQKIFGTKLTFALCNYKVHE